MINILLIALIMHRQGSLFLASEYWARKSNMLELQVEGGHGFSGNLFAVSLPTLYDQ